LFPLLPVISYPGYFVLPSTKFVIILNLNIKPMKEPKTKAGKLIRKILNVLRNESIDHIDKILVKLTDGELLEISQALQKEMEKRMIPKRD
jgi:hypothetical protein